MNQNFTRISGTGNTFIFFNNIDLKFTSDKETRKKMVIDLCQNYDGINSDGFVFCDPSQTHNFKWDFYNSDSSEAEMCGNAARCAAIYYYYKIKPEKKIKFESRAGLIECEIINIDDLIVKTKMPNIFDQDKIPKVKIDDTIIRGYFVNTGVPHYVLQAEPDLELAKKIRSAKEFGENGTNVTFIEIDDSDYMHAITYERGVENFTLACGTGAVAAASFFKHINIEYDGEIYIEMPGGVLSVEFEKNTPYLTGEVDLQYDFSIYKEDL